MYSKKVSEGFIVTVGNTNLWNPISYDEYSAIIRAIENRPKPPTGYDYKLNDASLEWELVKLPPIEPEPLTEEEALTRYANTLTGASDQTLVEAAETLIEQRIKEEH